MKKSAFTLVEALVCIAILATLAGLSYPVFMQVRKDSTKTNCVSNLKQYGLALSLYREQHAKVDYGTPLDMGMPPNQAPLKLMNLKCKGTAPGPGYTFLFVNDGQPELVERWVKEVEHYRDDLVVIYDVSHQDNYPKSFVWQRWHAIGLRLNGSTAVKIRMGYPFGSGWWK